MTVETNTAPILKCGVAVLCILSRGTLAAPIEKTLGDALQELHALPVPPEDSYVWIPSIVISEKFSVFTSSSSRSDEMTVVGRRSLSWAKMRELQDAEFNRLFAKFGPANESLSAEIGKAADKALGFPDGMRFRSDMFGLTISFGGVKSIMPSVDAPDEKQ